MYKNDRLTPNFILGEYFENKESWEYFLSLSPEKQKSIFNMIKIHAEKLQLFREYKKDPIYITSGFRSPTTNKNDGGVKSSYHLLGMAADIYYSGIHNTNQVDFLHLSLVFNGLLYYSKNKFFHTDIRPLNLKYQNLHWR